MKSGFYVDASELQTIQKALGATYKQTNLAYNRALEKTLNKLQINSISMMRDVTGAKKKEIIKRRVKIFTVRTSGGNSRMPGHGKIWLGLNDMPVSAIKGTMKNPSGGKAKNRKRDERGRFISGRGSRGATFNPKSSGLNTTSYPGGFVTTFRGKRSIYFRTEGKPFLSEAKIHISDPVKEEIPSDIFAGANELLMEIFNKELKGLVKRGYNG
ncbi:hypothetical protein D8682_25300 [Buttiauxella sp. 3AFRM03]|uniref:hypothetical protein n=1 Tax=Buttiauxella sp. 3AFRM03 TaxID=2479367 RepID=UPI000EF826B2|nr:hypothetical protein [Buttiauxella sp. 3AFRM03]AYN30002.1 hypothetical protein D8682_25300 [Buttiauxella sp. 3AFRM03]